VLSAVTPLGNSSAFAPQRFGGTTFA
jgi:hypothetical protein